MEEQERRIVQLLTNRTIRDAAFRRAIVDAYDNRCAVTGLRIVNGGGKAEVQAAHIWPVSDGGPDTVQNGLALSATAHWCFDRHLIAVTDDYRLLVSHNKVPAELRGLFFPADGWHSPAGRPATMAASRLSPETPGAICGSFLGHDQSSARRVESSHIEMAATEASTPTSRSLIVSTAMAVASTLDADDQKRH